MASRLNQAAGIITTLRRAGMIAPMRPDRYLKMAAAMRGEGMGMAVGFASAAQRCTVIGVDDEQYGHRLAAFVVLEPGGSATPDVLKQHVRDNLANYKVPRELSVLDELPRGSTGKVLRNELNSRVSG
jgi:acyl-CoA synthetase (AMP-forming)/AMP-acid ligase II